MQFIVALQSSPKCAGWLWIHTMQVEQDCAKRQVVLAELRGVFCI
jgi:hypothetical protein